MRVEEFKFRDQGPRNASLLGTPSRACSGHYRATQWTANLPFKVDLPRENRFEGLSWYKFGHVIPWGS